MKKIDTLKFSEISDSSINKTNQIERAFIRTFDIRYFLFDWETLQYIAL